MNDGPIRDCAKCICFLVCNHRQSAHDLLEHMRDRGQISSGADMLEATDAVYYAVGMNCRTWKLREEVSP